MDDASISQERNLENQFFPDLDFQKITTPPLAAKTIAGTGSKWGV
jgi:hypothetical protein